MVKAEQHDIDRAGRLIFSEVFQGLNCIPNQVSEDYGIDYNVQAFDGKEPTGAWFQVQLKSSSRLSRVDSARFISYSLDLSHLFHYAHESKQPVFLILVNVPTREVYWTCPLFESTTICSAQLQGRNNLALRVPTSQALPNSAAQFLTTLNNAYLLLAARQLSETPVAAFEAALRQALLDDKTLQGIQERQDQIRLHKSSTAFHEEKYDEAEKRLQGMLDDLDTTVHGKFNALMQLNAVEFRRMLFSGTQAIDIASVNLTYASRLRQLGGRKHKAIRIAAALVHATARVEKIVHIDAADYMAFRVHSQSAKNTAIRLRLMVRRVANAREIVRLYNRAVSILHSLTASRESLSLGRFITRIPTSISPYLVTLESSSDFEASRQFIKSALNILDLSVTVVSAAGDERGVGIAILAGLTLGHEEDSDAFRWAEKTKDRISGPQDYEEVSSLIEETRRRWRGVQIEGDYNPDPLWQIYQKIARSVGVDISDETSLLVRRLRIAAADDSPEPWLKFCSHVVMSNGAISPVDISIRHNFGVDTSCNKIAHCNLFDLHYEQPSGSKAFDVLYCRHCCSCSSRDPRPDDWTLNAAEREVWEKENAVFLRLAYLKGYGTKFVLRDALET